MPYYDYQCDECEHVFEEFHSMNASPELECPSCKSENVVKMVSGGAGVHFKGSGFYATDYKEQT